MSDSKIIIISVLITGLIFLIKERKGIISFFNKIKNLNSDSNEIKEIKKIMKEENASFNKAKETFFDREIIKFINISKTKWEIGNGKVLEQGDKVSFIDKEIGYIQGDFFGLIRPKAVGYGDLYILKKPDNTFRQAPIAYVKKDTINVYK